MARLKNPLRGPPPKEVPLPAAPLVRVIAQVRFPAVLSVEQPGFIAPFQEALRDDFPVLRREQSKVLVAPQVQLASSPAWRFMDVEGTTRISLAQEFLALETVAYTSRAAFLGKLGAATTALCECIRPRVMDRLGIRYIDRVTGKELAKLPQLVRPDVLGVGSGDLAGNVVHSVSESVFEAPEESARLLARWGHLPANGTVDPTALEPIGERSWVLDLDMFRQESRPLDAETLLKDAQAYAQRMYSFFRWAVTDEFLTAFGGEP